MGKHPLVMFAVSCVAVMAAAGTASASDNSGAAQQCQQGGYLNMQRSDGSTFKNVGDCVSYFADGGTAAACNYTSGQTGCMTFHNVTLPSGDGSETMTVTGAFLFSTTACNSLPVLVINTPCVAVPNSLATGGGRYTVTDKATGATVTMGTFSADDTTGTYEGLLASYFSTGDGKTTETCSAAAARAVTLFASVSGQTAPTGPTPGFEITGITAPDTLGYPGVVVTPENVTGLTDYFGGPVTNLSITC